MSSLVFERLATTRSVNAAAILEQLATFDDAHVQDRFDYLLGTWGTYHAEDALAWALTHVELVPDSAYRSIARGLGNTDPELAMDSVARLPSDVRDVWIANAAAGMAHNDLRGALSFISRYETRAFYDDAGLWLMLGRAEGTGPAADSVWHR